MPFRALQRSCVGEPSPTHRHISACQQNTYIILQLILCTMGTNVRVTPDVYETLTELKYDFRLPTLNLVIERLLAIADVEPYNEEFE